MSSYISQKFDLVNCPICDSVTVKQKDNSTIYCNNCGKFIDLNEAK